MSAIAAEISQELSANGEDDTRFTIARDQGDRLSFCVLNVESSIDDLLEFIKGVS
jgi:hypothetical protein